MIGWTKHRKRCPEHGLVLRKDDQYSRKANYCPACGKQLTVVSVPYLFQVYFHPALAIVPGILLFFGGLFFFLDVRGCVIEDRKADAIAKIEQEAFHAELMDNLPEDWTTVYAAVREANKTLSINGWNVLKDYLEQQKDQKLSRLTADEVAMFMQLMPSGTGDEAFALMTKHMEDTK